MANVKFQAPNPYSQQAADLNRRQKMAEMLQQQSMEPLQQQSAGGMVIPLNPLAGLAKVLQSYTSSRQLSDLDKKRAGLEAQDIQRAQEMMAQFRSSATEQPIAEGDNTLRELAVRPMAQSSGVKPVVRSQLMKAGLAPGSEDYEAASAPARLNELVSPAVSLAERQQNLLPAAMGAGVGPYQQKLAEMLYNEKPEAPKGAFAPINMKDVDVSKSNMPKYRETGDPAYLTMLAPKTTAPTESTLSRVMRERDALPIDDPRRKVLDSYISKQTKPDSTSSRTAVPGYDRFTPESLDKFELTGRRTDLVEKPDPQKAYRQEDILRSNFEKKTQPYVLEIDATSKILEIASMIPPGQRPDSITQQSFVVLLNKFLDPGSVVREAEFDRVLQAQGVISRVALLKNKILKGEILDQTSLDQITNLAKMYQEIATRKINKSALEFADVAKKRKLDVGSVILNPSYLEPFVPFAGNPEVPAGFVIENP
jgi:hypothetical protein